MTPDQQTIQDFMDALFEPGDRINLRFLPTMKTKNTNWYWWQGMVSYEWDDIIDRNQRQDCYFGVNPRERDGGKAEDVEVCRSLCADFDHTTPDAAMQKVEDSGLPRPTVLVNSGHGAHAYWRLEDAVDPLQWRALQRGLIDLLGCDPKVKDTPRVMRLPLTRHVAKHEKGKPHTMCVVVFNDMTQHDIEDIVRHLPEATIDDHDAPPMPEGARDKLPKWATDFLVNGTGEGDRNSRAFDVAATMNGHGWPEDDARAMIVAAAERCTPPLSQGEALSAVRSAYSKPRSPSRPDMSHLDPKTAWQWNAAASVDPIELPEDTEDVWIVGEPSHRGSSRPEFSNVTTSRDKEGNDMTHAKHVDDITSAMQEATGGWPRRAGGMLFVPGDRARPGELPPDTAVRRLGSKNELFAWVQQQTTLYWPGAGRCTDQVTGANRSAVTRDEFYEHLNDTAKPAYASAELLPHHPPAPGVWYAPCVLKRTPRSVLEELVERFNWESAVDRSLMMAALLTMFWGGPSGARPAFVVTSEHGAGAGKSVTAQKLAEVAGGIIEMNQNEKPEDFAKRLLSDAALRQRAVLLDNVKTRLDAQGIESMITAPEISGHRMYFGHATRPNRMTWFVTANAPQLSHDLAERSYNIRIGAQRSGSEWLEETTKWITDNRCAIIAAALGVLDGPAVCEIQHRDRWSAWQSAVLSKVEGGAEVAAVTGERRQAMNADRDDADDIAIVVEGLLRHDGHRPAAAWAFVSSRALADAYNLWVGESTSRSRKQTVTFIKNRVGNGALKRLRYTKLHGDRGFAFLGEDLEGTVPPRYTAHIMDIPDGLEAADLRPPEGGML